MHSKRRAEESGYALLMAMFLVATIILMAAVATPNILTQGKREKEQELVWRGNQYVRAFRLYFRKNGRYPQRLEDLTKGDAAGLHYIRKPYSDPVNTGDGSWRVIYVSPSGQLTGSVHFHTLQEMATGMNGAGVAIGANGQQGGQTAQSGGLQSGFGAQQGGQQASGFGFSGAQSGAQTAQTTQATSGIQGLSATQPQSAKLEAVDSPVMGAFAIGVASKVKKPSLRVYQRGTTYFDWEFIWNPLLTPGATGQANSPVLPGVPGTGTPGATAPGSAAPGTAPAQGAPGQAAPATNPGDTGRPGAPNMGALPGAPAAPPNPGATTPPGTQPPSGAAGTPPGTNPAPPAAEPGRPQPAEPGSNVTPPTNPQ
jgi:hypothetical protein